MWLCRFLHGQALVGLLLLAAIPVGGPPRAQSEVELEALHQRVMALADKVQAIFVPLIENA